MENSGNWGTIFSKERFDTICVIIKLSQCGHVRFRGTVHCRKSNRLLIAYVLLILSLSRFPEVLDMTGGFRSWISKDVNLRCVD